MKICWYRFNIYLALALAAAAVCGCQTSGESKAKKLLSTLRLHLEASRDGTKAQRSPSRSIASSPFMVNVEKDAFPRRGECVWGQSCRCGRGLRSAHPVRPCGHRHCWSSTPPANRGKKIAVFCQFGEKLKNVRWLAAPVISRRISDGVFIFTPDATREEAEEIALGLNNVFKKRQTWIDK